MTLVRIPRHLFCKTDKHIFGIDPELKSKTQLRFINNFVLLFSPSFIAVDLPSTVTVVDDCVFPSGNVTALQIYSPASEKLTFFKMIVASVSE